MLGIDSRDGELCGVVKPQEARRAPYEVRIWVRDDGLAYECSCPVGTSRQFCKHAVAITLAHLAKQRQKAEREAERQLALLRARLLAIEPLPLLDSLLRTARQDPALLDALKQICDDAGQ